MSDAKRILIVDDVEEITSAMRDVLEEEGYQVVSAANGAEALTLLRADGELPRLILLDLMMPEMDGFEFRAKQLRDPKLMNIPVLLMSAGADLPRKAKELKANGFLRKPFKDIETILDEVSKFV